MNLVADGPLARCLTMVLGIHMAVAGDIHLKTLSRLPRDECLRIR